MGNLVFNSYTYSIIPILLPGKQRKKQHFDIVTISVFLGWGSDWFLRACTVAIYGLWTLEGLEGCIYLIFLKSHLKTFYTALCNVIIKSQSW